MTRKLISTDAIKIAPDRQRKEFDEAKLQEFGDVLESKSLLNAIVLRIVGDDYYLVAGERRLRTTKDLHALGRTYSYDGEVVPAGFIPYTLLSDLDPLAAEEAELSENIDRVDLTWQERADAHLRLMALRTKQAEVTGATAPTVASISLEVRGSSEGSNQESTRRELIVAQHLKNPAVAAAKSVDEAFKILKREETKTKNQALGVAVGRTFNAELHHVHNVDSLSWMKSAEAGQFDCILTDPPYGMGADTFGDSGGVAAGAHDYVDSPEKLLEIIDVLAPESFRITKEQAHLYCFCDIDWFDTLKLKFAAAGWNVFRTPWIWYKKAGMRAPWPEYGPQRKYETILYAVKGKRPVLRMAGDVLEYPTDANIGHPAQKPVALYADLISRTCLPGQQVCDPFCGSGPIFAAAHELKVIATGLELSTAHYGTAVQRIQRLKTLNPDDLLKGL